MLDEHIWLGGMPVAVLKTWLTVAFARSTSTNCARNDEYDACAAHGSASAEAAALRQGTAFEGD